MGSNKKVIKKTTLSYFINPKHIRSVYYKINNSKLYYYIMVLFFLALSGHNIYNMSKDIIDIITRIKENLPKDINQQHFLQKVMSVYEYIYKNQLRLKTLSIPFTTLFILLNVYELTDKESYSLKNLKKRNEDFILNKIVIYSSDKYTVFSKIILYTFLTEIYISIKNEIKLHLGIDLNL
jgi:hypothetical protein